MGGFRVELQDTLVQFTERRQHSKIIDLNCKDMFNGANTVKFSVFIGGNSPKHFINNYKYKYPFSCPEGVVQTLKPDV